MTGWLDPPHERVTLSAAEVRTLARLERAFHEECHPPAAAAQAVYGKPRRRERVLAECVRWAPRAPWLIVVGVVTLAVGVPVSTAVAIAGVVLIALGAAAGLRLLAAPGGLRHPSGSRRRRRLSVSRTRRRGRRRASKPRL